MYIIGDIDVYYETVTSMCIMSKDSDIGVSYVYAKSRACAGCADVYGFRFLFISNMWMYVCFFVFHMFINVHIYVSALEASW